jgi:hypothetical protein
MKTSTVLKLRRIKRTVKEEWQLVTDDEIAVVLGCFSLVLAMLVAGAMCYNIIY